MKRIAQTLAVLFVFSSVNGQDIMCQQQLETAHYTYRTENSQVLKAERKVKIHLLYSHYIPFSYKYWGVMGLKLAVLDKWGGYLSSALSTKTGYGEFYLTGGAIVKVYPHSSIYFGGGIVGVGGGWGGPGYTYYGFESGVIFNIKFISLEAGLGSSIFTQSFSWGSNTTEVDIGKRVFAKLGIGANF